MVQNQGIVCTATVPSQEWGPNTVITPVKIKKQREERLNQAISEDRFSSRTLRRQYLEKRDGYRCSVCNLTEWCGAEIILEVDHVDGNHKNNKGVNLRFLCPNCHSQTPTYKALNKGNGRAYRRKHA